MLLLLADKLVHRDAVFFTSSTQNTVDIQKAFGCRIFGLQNTRLDSWYIPEKFLKIKIPYSLCGFWWHEAKSCKSFSKFFTDVSVMTFGQLKLNMSVSGIRIFLNHNKIEGVFLSKISFLFRAITYQCNRYKHYRRRGYRRGGYKVVVCFIQKVINNFVFSFWFRCTV